MITKNSISNMNNSNTEPVNTNVTPLFWMFAPCYDEYESECGNIMMLYHLDR